MPAAKNLLERARGRTFSPWRHAELLESDDSLLQAPISADDPDFEHEMKLAELVVYYRHVARRPRERRDVALAFRDAVNGDYGRFHDVFTNENGRSVKIARRDDAWTLVPCDCLHCRPTEGAHNGRTRHPL